MKQEDRENLARAYESAWMAVKNRPITITIESDGWFTRRFYGWSGLPDKKRASDLIRGLADLTSQLPKKGTV